DTHCLHDALPICLVDVAQDVIVREDECGTDRGLEVRALTDGTEVIERLDERIVGRHTKKTIFHPETGETILERDALITEDIARVIVEAGIDAVTIRSAFTCNTKQYVSKNGEDST